MRNPLLVSTTWEVEQALSEVCTPRIGDAIVGIGGWFLEHCSPVLAQGTLGSLMLLMLCKLIFASSVAATCASLSRQTSFGVR